MMSHRKREYYCSSRSVACLQVDNGGGGGADQGRDRQAQQLSGLLFSSYQALSSLFSLSVGGPQRDRRQSGSRSRLVADSLHSSWSPQLALYILIALLLH